MSGLRGVGASAPAMRGRDMSNRRKQSWKGALAARKAKMAIRRKMAARETGTFGPASDCRHIDPETGQLIEVTPVKGAGKRQRRKNRARPRP
jgi:hypothetical protein